MDICFNFFELRTFSLSLTSVQFSCSVLSNSLWPHESQHARPPCPSLTPGVHSDSRPLSQWCHPAISSSVIPFSSWPQSLPASESFSMSQLFAWGGQSTGVSATASFFPKKSQGWSPSEWTGWISLLSKGLSRVFSNTTVQKHQFFGTVYKRGNWLATWWQFDYIRSLLPQRQQRSIFTRITHILDMDLFFLSIIFSASISQGHTGCLTIMTFCTVLCVIKELTYCKRSTALGSYSLH